MKSRREDLASNSSRRKGLILVSEQAVLLRIAAYRVV
jgi:hypothetical protein